jgi:hypothetical protein
MKIKIVGFKGQPPEPTGERRLELRLVDGLISVASANEIGCAVAVLLNKSDKIGIWRVDE